MQELQNSLSLEFFNNGNKNFQTMKQDFFERNPVICQRMDKLEIWNQFRSLSEYLSIFDTNLNENRKNLKLRVTKHRATHSLLKN